jgi:hypothetical protein
MEHSLFFRRGGRYRQRLGAAVLPSRCDGWCAFVFLGRCAVVAACGSFLVSSPERGTNGGFYRSGGHLSTAPDSPAQSEGGCISFMRDHLEGSICSHPEGGRDSVQANFVGIEDLCG